MEQEQKKLKILPDCRKPPFTSQRNGAKGEYNLALEQLNEALSILPSSVSVTLISDLYKAKQQMVWYKW